MQPGQVLTRMCWLGLWFFDPYFVDERHPRQSPQCSGVHQQAKYARAEAVRAAKVRARAAFRTHETAKINLDAVQRELKASKLVAAGIASEAQFGQKTTLDLLDAEQDVNDAELRLVTAAHNLRLAAYRLQAAIGGLTAKS